MTPEMEAVVTPPPEVIERGRRERDFFNRYSDPEKIPDDALVVPPLLDAIPDELGEHFPSLEGVTVCEFGCGYGIVGAYLAQRGARVFAFDIADSNVIVAQRTARVNGVSDRMVIQIMQGECLSYPDDAFDLVFGNAVLHHLHIPTAVHGIRRVLKPGGVAIFREPLGENRLLECARNCPLRSSGHRHTADERSFLYSDMEAIRAVFPDARFRESELLTVFRALVRGNVGMASILRFESVMQKMARVDRWILSRCPAIRRLASYGVLTMQKPMCTGLVLE
jgi:SAM-dependent methyltransferase